MLYLGVPEPPVLYGDLEYLGSSEYQVVWTSRLISNIIKHRLTYQRVKENRLSYQRVKVSRLTYQRVEITRLTY